MQKKGRETTSGRTRWKELHERSCCELILIVHQSQGVVCKITQHSEASSRKYSSKTTFPFIKCTSPDSTQCFHNHSLCIFLKHPWVEASHEDHICTSQGGVTTKYHNNPRRYYVSKMSARFFTLEVTQRSSLWAGRSQTIPQNRK